MTMRVQNAFYLLLLVGLLAESSDAWAESGVSAPAPWNLLDIVPGFSLGLAIVALALLIWKYRSSSGASHGGAPTSNELAALNEELERRVEERTTQLSRAVEEHEHDKRVLEAFFDQSQTLNLVLDFKGKILRLNRSWEDVLGRTLEEIQSGNLLDFVAEEDKDTTKRALAKLTSGTNLDGVENRCVSKDGDISNLRWSARSDMDDKLIYAVAQNITDQKRAEEALRLTASVFTFSDEGIMITDPDGTIIDVNEAFTTITGYGRTEALGQNANILKSGKHDDSLYQDMWSRLEDEGVWRGEVWNKTKDGRDYPEMLTISAVEDDNGKTTSYVGLFSDITRIKAHEEELRRLAQFDELTGLPNRILLNEHIGQTMARARRHGFSLAVAFIDLDGFKAVNDTYGHAAGDQVLVEISRRLKATLRQEDPLARIGGDEFVAVIADLKAQEDCAGTLERILKAAEQDIDLGEAKVSVTASIGVTFYPQDADIDAEKLEWQADQAMYSAKLAGRNQFRFYQPKSDRASA